MNELFDYGRPSSIALVVLADRGGRQLPIEAQHCGRAARSPAGKAPAPETQRQRSCRWSSRCRPCRITAAHANGELQHLLSIEGLPREILEQILVTAESSPGSPSAK